jgi:hypothetical protein
MSPTDESGQYSLTSEAREEYQYVFVECADPSAATVKAYWKEIGALCRRNKVQKLLVEKAAGPLVSTIDAFDVATSLRDYGLESVKIAFYEQEAAINETTIFPETVAANRGLRLRVFDDIEKAKAWLLED